VSEAVVVGLPHERWSEAITAVVVPKAGETVDESRADRHAQGHAGWLQGAQGGHLRRELPKTSTGKIQKNVLRSEHADHYKEA